MATFVKPFGRAFSAKRDLIRKGNIHYTREDLARPESLVPLYLANGTTGGCFDAFGAMIDGATGHPLPMDGETTLCHATHFTRDAQGLDEALPVGRLHLELDSFHGQADQLGRVEEYEQELDLCEALLHTRFELTRHDAGPLQVERRQFFSQSRGPLFCLRQQVEAPTPVTLRVRFVPAREFNLCYGDPFRCEAPCHQAGRELWWPLETRGGATFVVLHVTGGEVHDGTEDGLAVELYGAQQTFIWLSVLSTHDDDDPLEAARSIISVAVQDGWERLLAEHQETWRHFWSDSLIRFPEAATQQQQMWLRGNYYLGSTLSRTDARPTPTTGLARVGQPSFNPSDYLCLYQNALTANHMGPAMATRNYWYDRLDPAREYARAVYDLPGAAYPWWLPLHDAAPSPGDPLPDERFHQHHHQAAIARLCWDAFTHSGDANHLRNNGYPVLKALAEMFEGMLTNPEGHDAVRIAFTPARSRDHHAPADRANYFDLLLAAEYVFRVAARAAGVLSVDRQHRERWLDYVSRDFAWAALARDEGYGVYEGDDRPACSQSHPVQLDPITHFPVKHLYQDPRVLRSYLQRDGLVRDPATGDARGEFLLASARLRSADGFRHDWQQLRETGLVDERWVQTRRQADSPAGYHLATHGLVMQALTCCAVQGWRNVIDVFPLVLPEWEAQESPFLFEGLRVSGGFVLSGVYDGGLRELELLSTANGRLSIKVPPEWMSGVLTQVPDRRIANEPGGQILSAPTLAGQRYQLRPL